MTGNPPIVASENCMQLKDFINDEKLNQIGPEIFKTQKSVLQLTQVGVFVEVWRIDSPMMTVRL